MKILQVITSLRIGGAEKLITEIAPLLRMKGHEVDILAIDGEESYFLDTLRSNGFKVITFGNKCNPYHPKFVFKIIGIMRNYDVVHTHLTSAQLFVAIGSLFSKKPALFTTEHNTTNRRRDNKLYRLFDKWMYSRYKKVICI
jgi:glycosyltransferase involved in cell wall biosynthesis